MGGPIRAVLHGATDGSQIEEACRLGVDAVAIEVGTEDRGSAVSPEAAVRLARHVAPLTARLAALPQGAPLPEGWQGVVTGPDTGPPEGAGLHVVRLGVEALSGGALPGQPDLVWLRPRRDRTGAGSAFDFARVERLARRYPLLLEIPDGAAGVEVAVRLGHPLGVVLGEAVWLQPGIVDLNRLEAALGVVARLNRAALDR
jgi:hypothetical protein